MRELDLTPFYRNSVGFDTVAAALANMVAKDGPPNFPPYNIVKTGDLDYRITLAVAGFSQDDIEIESKQSEAMNTPAGKTQRIALKKLEQAKSEYWEAKSRTSPRPWSDANEAQQTAAYQEYVSKANRALHVGAIEGPDGLVLLELDELPKEKYPDLVPPQGE